MKDPFIPGVRGRGPKYLSKCEFVSRFGDLSVRVGVRGCSCLSLVSVADRVQDIDTI